MTAKLAVKLMLFWAVAMAANAPPAVPAQDMRHLVGKYSPAEIMEQLKLSRTNYAAAYDGYAGMLTLDFIGDAGGHAKLHVAMDGFYVRPTLTLSQAVSGVIPQGENYQDSYEIIPQKVTVTGSMNTIRHCVAPKSTIYSKFSGVLSRLLAYPAPPNFESTDMSIPQWIYPAMSSFHGDALRFSFKVVSSQASGGQAWLTVDAYALVDGVLSSASGSRNKRGKIGLTHAKPEGEHVSVRVGTVWWRMPGPILLTTPFSLEDISLNVAGSTTHQVDHCGPGYVQESDQSWHIKYRLTVAAKKEIKAVLSAADGDAADWRPEPDDVRTFKLTLEEPGPEEVEEVRFTLENATGHAGIAANAGNHALAEMCADCTLNKEPEIYFHSTRFSHDDGSTYPVTRSHVHYNDCPIDALPDLFFSGRENQGYDLSDGGTRQNLQYMVSQVARLKEVNDQEISVKVTVKDGAAYGKLGAEVKVAGVWHPAVASGASANADGTHLLLPDDQDHDQVADSWQKEHAYGGLSEDLDRLEGNPAAGDGFSVFEEYRGIYSQGGHERLDPARVDVMAHDYARQFGAYLDQVDALFERQGLKLWQLTGSEHREEVVNYQPGEHRAGGQYLIAVMALSQCPGLDFGRALGAAYVSPPVAEANTVVINDGSFRALGVATSLGEVMGQGHATSAQRTRVGVLAHEIGHNLDLPHHGEGDRELTRTLTSSGGRQVTDRMWVACLGGEHSGAQDCFMRYNCADYYLERDFVPASWVTRWVLGIMSELKPFPQAAFGAEDHFCTTARGAGPCGDAAGGGSCLHHLSPRSY